MQRLRRLSINNCADLNQLAIGAGPGRNWLPNLEVLALHGLPNTTGVWRNLENRGCFQSLHSINIWHCHRLKNVSWISGLPKLEKIYLFYCHEIEEVIGGEEITEAGLVAFPVLRTMSIRDLPEPKSISQQVMGCPFLERLAIIDCPRLKKLPLKASKASAFLTAYGDQKWWDNLEWDVDAESSFPHFIAT